MDKIVGEIYSTMNYEQFKMIETNRDVLEERVRRISKSFDIKIIRNPIIVNQNMEIIDGQGRFTVLKQRGLPIEYIIIEGAGARECRIINQSQTNWTNTDFIKSFASENNSNYIRLQEVIHATGYKPEVVLQAANKSNRSKSKAAIKTGITNNEIRNGRLIYDSSDMTKSIDNLRKMDEILKALMFEKSPTTTLICSILAMFKCEGYDHRRMVSKCERFRNQFGYFGNMRDQLVEFSRIYNDHAKKESCMYFEYYLDNKGRNVRRY